MVKKTGFKIFVGIALAILLFALLNLGVYAFYDSPQYEDFCSQATPDNYTQCSESYQNAQDSYNRVIFYIYVVIGLILSVLGLFIPNITFQITSFGSGIAFIIEGIFRNLNDKIPAFIVGAIAFGIICFFFYKRFAK
jgi:Na+-driven multidrug efflux pump